jgi:hypothetical protein
MLVVVKTAMNPGTIKVGNSLRMAASGTMMTAFWDRRRVVS